MKSIRKQLGKTAVTLLLNSSSIIGLSQDAGATSDKTQVQKAVVLPALSSIK